MQRNDLFEEFLSEFRIHHSTETALIKVTNDIFIASDTEITYVLGLLDLSAVFSTEIGVHCGY